MSTPKAYKYIFEIVIWSKGKIIFYVSRAIKKKKMDVVLCCIEPFIWDVDFGKNYSTDFFFL